MIIETEERYKKALEEIEVLLGKTEEKQGISWEDADELDSLCLEVEAYENEDLHTLIEFPTKGYEE